MTYSATMTHRHPRISPGRILGWLVFGIISFIMIFPLWWVLRTALTDSGSMYTDTTALLPVNPTTFNIERVLGLVSREEALAMGGSGATINFFQFMRNSVVVVGLSVVGQTLFSAMAAYAFARLKFPLRDRLFFLFISALMIPGVVTLIPNFILIRELNWINTIQGIVAPRFLMTPFAVFFLRQFFLGINRELEEAAQIDGAGYATIFWRVVLPVSMTPIITLGILLTITEWNDYLWPLLVGRDESVRTLTVALGIFRQQTPQGLPDWTGMMAGAFVAMVPTLLLFLLMGRRTVNSIQFGSLK